MRYQDTIAGGRSPRKSVVHLPDTFVWTERITHRRYTGLPNIARVYYYTSVTGDDDQVQETKERLCAQSFASPLSGEAHIAQVVPIVFKKLKKSSKTRNVDIQIVIDVMRFAFSGGIDRVYLASGDGDYLPLIQEVMRRGVQVELLAFKSGLNPRLKASVDKLHLLDDAFFEDL